MVEFRAEDACSYGDREAIMISYFRYWITKNRSNGKHFYDGHYWTYNSIMALSRIMPYWSVKQIRNTLDSLIKKGVLIEGNYNKAGYDRTKWYAFSDEALFLDICQNGQMDLPKSTNGIAQMGKPIPISIPISKPISNNINDTENENIVDNATNAYEDGFEKFWNKYPKHIAKQTAKRAYISALKNKKTTHDEIMKGLDNYLAQIKHDKTELQFIKYPSTWLNGGCWEDEYEYKKKPKGSLLC